MYGVHTYGECPADQHQAILQGSELVLDGIRSFVRRKAEECHSSPRGRVGVTKAGIGTNTASTRLLTGQVSSRGGGDADLPGCGACRSRIGSRSVTQGGIHGVSDTEQGRVAGRDNGDSGGNSRRSGVDSHEVALRTSSTG
jgi:hypothetical protein